MTYWQTFNTKRHGENLGLPVIAIHRCPCRGGFWVRAVERGAVGETAWPRMGAVGLVMQIKTGREAASGVRGRRGRTRCGSLRRKPHAFPARTDGAAEPVGL